MNHAYHLINQYQPILESEKVFKKQMLTFLKACPDCFLRSCQVGHFTASAFLTSPDLSSVLLMHHRKLDRWMQLGGHCDGDSNLLNVAIKEAQEESGIDAIKPLDTEIFDLDIHLIPPNPKEAAHYHFDVRFLLHAYAHDDFKRNNESKDMKWFKINSPTLPTHCSSVLKLFNKYKKWHESQQIVISETA